MNSIGVRGDFCKYVYSIMDSLVMPYPQYEGTRVKLSYFNYYPPLQRNYSSLFRYSTQNNLWSINFYDVPLNADFGDILESGVCTSRIINEPLFKYFLKRIGPVMR